jgi:hypothetical protein
MSGRRPAKKLTLAQLKKYRAKRNALSQRLTIVRLETSMAGWWQLNRSQGKSYIGRRHRYGRSL